MFGCCRHRHFPSPQTGFVHSVPCQNANTNVFLPLRFLNLHIHQRRSKHYTDRNNIAVSRRHHSCPLCCRETPPTGGVSPTSRPPLLAAARAIPTRATAGTRRNTLMISVANRFSNMLWYRASSSRFSHSRARPRCLRSVKAPPPGHGFTDAQFWLPVPILAAHTDVAAARRYQNRAHYHAPLIIAVPHQSGPIIQQPLF